MAIYIEYDGITGNVTAKGYEDQISAASVQFGVGRAITMEAGNMSTREATRPSISEISISKELDNASGPLFKEAVTGGAGKKVKIHFVRTMDDQLQEYCTYELEDVLVSSFSVSADGADGAAPYESITLSFAKIEVSNTYSDKSNKAGKSFRAGYDLAAAKAV